MNTEKIPPRVRVKGDIREILKKRLHGTFVKNDIWYTDMIYDSITEEIVNALNLDEPKTEPLEVDIWNDLGRETYFKIRIFSSKNDIYFKSKQEAIDFCKRHGLKIREN